jgi:hypothetical protein
MQDESSTPRGWRYAASSDSYRRVIDLLQTLTDEELICLITFDARHELEERQPPRMPAINTSTPWGKIRHTVLHRDAFICQYCGDAATHVDHVMPRSRGGSDDLANLVAACAPCNFLKRNRTPEEWRR